MKEKSYTVSVDVQVTKEDKPNAKRRYYLKIYRHPINENPKPIEYDLANMRDEQTLVVGKCVLGAIWELVKDDKYWDS